VTIRVDERVLLDDVSWQLGPGDRIGVVGANGSGKTTLLRLLAGKSLADSEPAEDLRRPEGHPGADKTPRPNNPPTDAVPGSGLVVEGHITRGKTVRLGFLAQDEDDLDPSMTAREAVADVRGNLKQSEGAGSVGFLLEQLGLRGDTQFNPVAELSGGERRRVQILRVLVGEPNVLFMDEPTNDLDVDTLTELEDLLDGWPGSMLVVSHDRYFLERITDHVVALLGDGKLSFLGGGVDEYLARRAALRLAASGERAGSGAGGAPEANRGAGSAGAQRAARKELQRLERQIDRLTVREKELTESLAAHASDYARLVELGGQLREVQAEKARFEEEWLTVAEESGAT